MFQVVLSLLLGRLDVEAWACKTQKPEVEPPPKALSRSWNHGSRVPRHHVVHAYTPATEPWEEWADLDEILYCILRSHIDEIKASQQQHAVSLGGHCLYQSARKSSEYKAKKREARDFLYSAVAKQVPDLEETALSWAAWDFV